MRLRSAFVFFLPILLLSCASVGGTVVRAEEYFSIAGAYFELGKYVEAERWYKLAAQHEKTRFASEYNLARIAFQKNESEGAARRFESLLKYDPSNAMVLRAAAYSWMKAKKWDKAIALFERISDLLPETEDARYNFALALSSADRLDEAFVKLLPFVQRNPDDRDALLLLARIEKRLQKPEAADHYSEVLKLKDDPAVKLESAEVFESLQLFAMALELYRSLAAAADSIPNVGKGELRFRAFRVMLLAGDDESKTLEELQAALDAGFSDAAALREAAGNDSISDSMKQHLEKAAEEIVLEPKASKEKENEATQEGLAPDALAPKPADNP